jgi:hypothetical protein
MRAIRTGLIGIVTVALAHGVAAANPIQVNVWGGIDGHMINQSVTLNDPSQPLTIATFSQMFFPTMSAPDASHGGMSVYSGGGTLGGPFYLNISVGPPDAPSAGATVEITGNTHGSYSVLNPLLPNISGSVDGSGTSAQLYLSPGTSPQDVPPYLADLLNHPERVGYSGMFDRTMSNASLLDSTLSIAPPVDPQAMVLAPEPSAMMVTLMALAGFPMARRLRGPRTQSGRS